MEIATDVKEEEIQLVVFHLANEEYALPITKVQDINRLTPITKLPKTPQFVEGVMNLRGRIIPVIDLRRRFNLAAAAATDETRIIVVEFKGKTIGGVVDSVTEVLRLSKRLIEPPPPSFSLDARYMTGVGKVNGRLLILLDLDQMLTDREADDLQAAGE